MKRKNCSISSQTPPEMKGGTCADNPAGRLRGTDLNRNYPGFWGGGGASPNWKSDTYRGDGPGSEPESDNLRKLISERQVTNLITNHTYSNLVLRPPSIKQTGFSPDEPVYRQLGSDMTEANGYANWAAFQLYDTSGSVEDWSYWNTGGFGFTFEIGPDEFHPPFQNGVVAEYLGLPPADGAGYGGNREAYYTMAEATIDESMHSTIAGKAPREPEADGEQVVHLGHLAGARCRGQRGCAALLRGHADVVVRHRGRQLPLGGQPVDPAAGGRTLRA